MKLILVLFMCTARKSHPTWVRGLKLNLKASIPRNKAVAPYVGAWIETINLTSAKQLVVVAPYVGAWIETLWC